VHGHLEISRGKRILGWEAKGLVARRVRCEEESGLNISGMRLERWCVGVARLKPACEIDEVESCAGWGVDRHLLRREWDAQARAVGWRWGVDVRRDARWRVRTLCGWKW